MPSRLLRDWTDSLRFDGISADAERLFTRLIMKADDYGRYHAEPRLVRSGCFPLADGLELAKVAQWISELASRGLIMLYMSGGKKLLVIRKFGQRLKMSRAKFPPPPGKPEDFLLLDAGFRELPGTSGNFRVEAHSDADANPEAHSDADGEGAGNLHVFAEQPAAAANGSEIQPPKINPPAKSRRKAEPITDDWLLTLQGRYNHVDVAQQYTKCQSWCEANGKALNRKRFVNWINRVEPPPQVNGAHSTKPKTSGWND